MSEPERRVPRYVRASWAHSELTPFVGAVPRDQLEDDLLTVQDEQAEMRAEIARLTAELAGANAHIERIAKHEAANRRLRQLAEDDNADLRAQLVELRAQLERVRGLLTVHKDRVETDDVLAALAGTLPQPHCPGCDIPEEDPR